MRLYRPLSPVCTPSREHPYPCVYIFTHARMLSYMHVETANFLTPLKCLSILVLCNRNNIVKIFNYIFYCPLNLLPLKSSTSKAGHESCDHREGVWGLGDVLSRTNKSKLWLLRIECLCPPKIDTFKLLSPMSWYLEMWPLRGNLVTRVGP